MKFKPRLLIWIFISLMSGGILLVAGTALFVLVARLTARFMS